jgi:hypothetical protein
LRGAAATGAATESFASTALGGGICRSSLAYGVDRFRGRWRKCGGRRRRRSARRAR